MLTAPWTPLTGVVDAEPPPTNRPESGESGPRGADPLRNPSLRRAVTAPRRHCAPEALGRSRVSRVVKALMRQASIVYYVAKQQYRAPACRAA